MGKRRDGNLDQLYQLPPVPNRALPTAPPLSPGAYLSPVHLSRLPPVPNDSQVHPYDSQKPEQIARFNVTKPNKLNKRHNPQLYTKRKCTDVFCCFLFFIFLVGWIIVAGIGLRWGNPERLIYATDSNFRRCGSFKEGAYNLTSKPYLLYFDMTKCISYTTALGGCQTTQICVSQCPKEYYSYLQLQTASSAEIQHKMETAVYCTDDVDKSAVRTFNELRSLVNQGRCTAYTVSSAAVLQRCFPQAILGAADNVNNLVNNGNLSVLRNAFGDDANVPKDEQVEGVGSEMIKQAVNNQPVLTKMVHDLMQTWWQTLAMIVCAGVLAFLWTVIMRILGSFMIWASILVVVGVLGFGAGYSWMKWNELKKAGAVDDFSFQPVFGVYFEMPTTWLVCAITSSSLLLLILVVVIFIRKRILMAVALIEESSKAIGSMMSTLVFPIFPFILHVGVFALWGSIAIWLSSSGQEVCRMSINGQVSNTSQLCDCNMNISGCMPTGIEKQDDKVFWLQVYNLFAFFWLSCFVTALGDIALAGAFASHYWARDKSRDVPSFPVIRALNRAIRYNLGSLAFGSLIVAIVKIIRVFLEYMDRKFAKTENTVIKYIMMCLKCCFWCLEVFFKFLSKNAYIMMAIYGKNFYSSAKDSFLLLTRNCIRAVVIHQVAGILLFIGKAMVTLAMGMVSFYYFSGKWVIDGIPRVDLYYYFVPIVIVVIGSYFIADMFFDVYEMAVDTTFICFLEDSEQNDGTPEKPYYMSSGLLQILGKENQIEMAEK